MGVNIIGVTEFTGWGAFSALFFWETGSGSPYGLCGRAELPPLKSIGAFTALFLSSAGNAGHPYNM